MKKKRVLIVTERFYPENFRINDFAHFLSDKMKVTVLTQQPSYPEGAIYKGYKNRLFQVTSWEQIKVIRVYSVMGYRDSLFRKCSNYLVHMILATMYTCVFGNRYDAVFCYHTGPLTNTLPAVMLRRLWRKRFILWSTDLWPDAVYAYGFKPSRVLDFFLNNFIRFVFRSPNKILVSSVGFIDRLEKIIPNVSFSVVPHWADESIVIQKPGENPFDPKRVNIVFTGNIGSVQNLDLVISSLKRVKVDKPFTLHLIGDGSFVSILKKQVENENISSVKFWGRFEASSLSRFYSHADALLISLKGDSFLETTVPGKFQTYLRMGKPILGAINGEVQQIIKEHKLGLFANATNIDSISNMFYEFLMKSKTEKRAYEKNAKILYEKKYRRDIIIPTIVKYLNEDTL